MLVQDIEELSKVAKNSLLQNGYRTLEDISKADFYDIFGLRFFKKNTKNIKIIIKIMHKHGYPDWGLTPIK